MLKILKKKTVANYNCYKKNLLFLQYYKNLATPRKNFAKHRFNATQNQQKYNFKYIFGKLIKIQLIFSRQTTTSLVRLRLQRNTVIALKKSHFGSSSALE